MKPYFSILIPACNMEGKMQDCMDSLTGQTFPDFEAIMVDDGSRDGTFKMLSDYAEADSRFKAVSHGENKSLLAARYTAMERAEGRYILFLDSDDYLEKDTLMSLKDSLDREPVDILRFGFKYEPGEEVLPPESDDPLTDIFMDRIPAAIWKNCYGAQVIRETLAKSEPFYCNMGEDVCLAGILFSCGKTFGRLERVFHHYILGNGMSNVRKASMEKAKRDIASVLASGSHLKDFIEKYNPEYMDRLDSKLRTMYRFVLFQNIFFESEITGMLEYLRLFKEEGLDDIYNWGCSKLLPAKIADMLKKSDERYRNIPEFTAEEYKRLIEAD